jgi:hypothetical protein
MLRPIPLQARRPRPERRILGQLARTFTVRVTARLLQMPQRLVERLAPREEEVTG